MVFCLLLDRQIIRLVFERGNFTPEATTLMSTVFFYYSLSLLFFSFVRVLTFYLFARNEAEAFLRLCILLYGTNVAFDLLYVGALRMGAIGIPLGLLTSLILTCGLAFYRNIAELKLALDRTLGMFTFKSLLSSGLATAAVWGLSAWIGSPATGFGNFAYLCVVCATGSLVFFATLAATRAVSISHLAAALKRSEDA
jgi:putative peptidoglycan lipid II flippase